MMSDAIDVQRAEWLLSNKRRWPLVAVVFAGATLTLHAVVVGRGRIAARASLVESRAAMLALKPPPVDPERNAATVWREAFARMQTWSGPRETDPLGPRSDVDWRQESVYQEGSPILLHLRANAAALDLADRAAELDACDWDLDYSRGGFMTEMPHLGPMRDIGRLLRLRAIFAAQFDDWRTFERSLRTAESAARHVYADRFLIAYLVAIALDQTMVEAMEGSLAAPGASPSVEVVRKLKEYVRERARTLPSLAEAVETEKGSGLFLIDSMGAGDLGFVERIGMTARLRENPMIFNWYSAIWRTDRDYYEAMMQCFAWQSAGAGRNAIRIFCANGIALPRARDCLGTR
jgi:hypothetical protein